MTNEQLKGWMRERGVPVDALVEETATSSASAGPLGDLAESWGFADPEALAAAVREGVTR